MNFKLIFFSLFFTASIGLYGQSNQNVEINLYDCNSFKTDHFLVKSEGASYSLQLEREYEPNLWNLVSRVVTDQPSHIFTNLENGNYRATLVETKLVGENSQIVKKISNHVVINCPQSKLSNFNKSELVNIFPNPTSNQVNIIFSNELKDFQNLSFEIQGLDGKVFLNGEIHQQNETIDLSSFSSNSYLLVIKQNKETLETKKLFITKN